MYHHLILAKNKFYNKRLSCFFYYGILACFIYGCNKISSPNYINQTSNKSVNDKANDNKWALKNFVPVKNKSNELFTALKRPDVNYVQGIKFKNIYKLSQSELSNIQQTTNEYGDTISILAQQHEGGDTVLHLMAKRTFHKLFSFFIQYLDSVSPKDPKDDIHKILSIKNNENLTIVDILTKEKYEDCGNLLFSRAYVPIDVAKNVINLIGECPDNPVVKSLRQYIENHNKVENTQNRSSSVPIKEISIKSDRLASISGNQDEVGGKRSAGLFSCINVNDEHSNKRIKSNNLASNLDSLQTPLMIVKSVVMKEEMFNEP